jgi:hypothetical protein
MGNFLGGLLQVFRPIRSLHFNVNRSRLFNSYESIFDLVICVVTYSVFSVTNQMMMIQLFLISTVFALFGNYIVHTSLPMRFIYSVVLCVIASSLSFIFDVILFIRLLNLNKVCSLLSRYFDKHPAKDNDSVTICQTQRNYYMIWIGAEFFVIGIKILSIVFAIKAHNVVKKKRKI